MRYPGGLNPRVPHDIFHFLISPFFVSLIVAIFPRAISQVLVFFCLRQLHAAYGRSIRTGLDSIHESQPKHMTSLRVDICFMCA